MGIVKVNRTGVQVKVYESNACTLQIGTLYNNEVFTWTGEWEGSGYGYYVQSIRFRGSDGSKKSGWVSGKQTDSIFSTNLATLAKFTKVSNGVTFYGFKMRREEELYDPKGTLLTKKALVGRNILCKNSTSGTNDPGLLLVHRLETGVGTGLYTEINPGSNAFVDMGYDKGSILSSSCSLIGSL